MRHLAAAMAACILFGTSAASADPPARTVAEADRAIRLAQIESRRLLGLLDQSRLRHDRRSEQCVDDKLAQVNSFSRMLLDRRRRLVADDGQTVESRERALIRAMVRQLRDVAREGRACVFPAAGGPSTTIVEVLAEPNLPHRDLSRVPDRTRR